MKKALYTLLSILLFNTLSRSQDFNWNTVSYTTGSLSTNFGSLGSPASTVSLNITGNTGTINSGFPVKYTADPSGTSNDCSVSCALRSSVTFTALNQTVVYTYTFSPAVTGITFRIYDIDGTDASSGDQATVTATSGMTAQNISMTTLSGATITGSETTTATVRGTQGNTTDDFTDVTVNSGITSLVITYSNNPNNPSAGNRSFSIGNMNWSGVLPVHFISFSGKKENNGTVKLKWTAEENDNADHYSIERSKNGQLYSEIGQFNAGNSGRNTYSFTDVNPGAGNSFYRIKQTDRNGQFEFSNIVLIKEGKNSDVAFTVFPNPATERITITTSGNAQIKRIQLYDAGGRMLYESKNAGNNIDITSLKSGVYWIKAEDASGEIYRTSFLKK